MPVLQKSMLLTLDNFKAQFPIGNSGQDAQMTDLIEGVSGRFARFCDRDFERAAAAVEYHDAKPFIALRLFPLETLALYYDTARVFGGGALQTADTDYVASKNSGQIQMLFLPAYYPQAIKAVIAGGYVAAGTTPEAGQFAIPDDLTRAMLAQCSYEWRLRAEKPGDLLTQTDLLPEVKASLQAYKRISF